MEERRHAWRQQAWVLELQGLNEVWEALGRVTEGGDDGKVKCRCKGGTVKEYANPYELAEREANSRSEEVTEMELTRWNMSEGTWAGVEFRQPSVPFPHSVRIFVHKKHSGAEADVNKVEQAVLSTRPRWWWMERGRLMLDVLTLIWCLMGLVVVGYVLLEGWSVWAIIAMFGWIVIELFNKASRWLLPAGTVAIGEGRVREENRRTIRWIISGTVSIVVLIVSIFFGATIPLPW